ncbi:MAG: hypothetical protein KAI40_03430 [Desulfobacterales bacterium]|nr:hypothetical protein [Desulfobacterales bacterium]
MSDFGLKIYDAAGNITLDGADCVTRLRYSVEIAAGVSGNVALNDIDGKSTCEFGIALEQNKTSHHVSRSGTTITWTAAGGILFPSSSTLVVVFLYT